MRIDNKFPILAAQTQFVVNEETATIYKAELEISDFFFKISNIAVMKRCLSEVRTSPCTENLK